MHNNWLTQIAVEKLRANFLGTNMAARDITDSNPKINGLLSEMECLCSYEWVMKGFQDKCIVNAFLWNSLVKIWQKIFGNETSVISLTNLRHYKHEIACHVLDDFGFKVLKVEALVTMLSPKAEWSDTVNRLVEILLPDSVENDLVVAFITATLRKKLRVNFEGRFH